MDFITFRKNTSETLLVTDTRDVFKITNDYFKFRESNYPFDSLQFSGYLKSEKISVVFIGEDFPNGELFKKYLKPDARMQAQKEEQIKVFEEKVKQDEKIQKELDKKKAQIEKKEEQARVKKELDRKNNIVVIKDSDIEENVSKHLMA